MNDTPSVCEEAAQSARENLASITATLEDLSADYDRLARCSDNHGLTKPSEILRHFSREIHLLLQQGNAVVGAVLAAEQKRGD